MRQLLTWCGTRALGEKPSFAAEDSHAKLAGETSRSMVIFVLWLIEYSSRDSAATSERLFNKVRNVGLVQ